MRNIVFSGRLIERGRTVGGMSYVGGFWMEHPGKGGFSAVISECTGCEGRTMSFNAEALRARRNRRAGPMGGQSP